MQPPNHSSTEATMDRTRIPNGGSSVMRGQKSPNGRYICQRTVPTLQAGLTKMFGVMILIFGILLIGNGIAVIIIRAGHYNVGAAVWAGAFTVCAGLVALLTATKRKKVVIGCVALSSLTIISVFAAGIVAGTGVQQDEETAALGDKTDMMKARIGLNVVTIALCIVIFFASIFIVYLCGRALDDAAYAKDVDVSKLYPSQLSHPPMEGVINPVYVEEQTRGVANAGSVRLLDPKQPILLLPLKEKHMDTLSVSYDLTDGHNQTCRIVRYNSSESIHWDRSVSREDLAHTESENEPQNYYEKNSTWNKEVAVDIERQGKVDSIHRQKLDEKPPDDTTYIAPVDQRKVSGYGESPENYQRSDCIKFEHPELSHWNTLASLDIESDSSLGFSDIVKMTPESSSPSFSRSNHEPQSPPPDEFKEEDLREFAKVFVGKICQAALDEVYAEKQEENDRDSSTLQSVSCDNIFVANSGQYNRNAGHSGSSSEMFSGGDYNEVVENNSSKSAVEMKTGKETAAASDCLYVSGKVVGQVYGCASISLSTGVTSCGQNNSIKENVSGSVGDTNNGTVGTNGSNSSVPGGATNGGEYTKASSRKSDSDDEMNGGQSKTTGSLLNASPGNSTASVEHNCSSGGVIHTYSVSSGTHDVYSGVIKSEKYSKRTGGSRALGLMDIINKVNDTDKDVSSAGSGFSSKSDLAVGEHR